ncbi:hypothetical protein CMESO_45 (nucleomorph) [Chroomonas mesostigmatica CCMP1168]|uniref:Uncharacterized protein n=1 Tax=Chroomonas mesostigmatica CCMP1168 TaxID=1195612 RepID=J7G7J2_9CRYP|nr:hypothetical protein CMESO_45 [Chroomonas mesostigmatica CCMP1168]|mmetsp:Transcript_60049/g.147656  ORF Transcript_60049/g.147656 Transcript_60049/m.147656 type:complete len:122 (+) Transcript_60049:3409-3774(+)
MKKNNIRFFDINQLFYREISPDQNSDNFFENLNIKIDSKLAKNIFDDLTREKNLGKPVFFKLKKFLKIIKNWHLMPKRRRKTKWVKSKNHLEQIQKKLADRILKSTSKKKKTVYFHKKKRN